MKVLVLEQDDDFREDLLLRIEEAVKLSLVRGISIVARSLLEAGSESPDLIFLSFLDEVDYTEVVGRVKGMFPEAEIVLIVPSEQYVEEAVELRRKTLYRVVATGDIPQIAQIFLDIEGSRSGLFGGPSGKLISVVHVSGGVGASSMALSLAQRFSDRKASTLLIDIDYVRQSLSNWARYGVLERREFGALVDSNVNITLEKIKAIIQQVPNIEGQTANTQFGFIGLLDSFVKSSTFLGSGVGYGSEGVERFESLLLELVSAYDSVVIDVGNLWGIGALTALSLSSKVIFAFPDDSLRLQSDLQFIQRMASESDDPLEFDFSKWESVLINKNAKSPATLEALSVELLETGVFGADKKLNILPPQKSATSWLAPGSEGVVQVDKNYEMELLSICRTISPRYFS